MTNDLVQGKTSPQGVKNNKKLILVLEDSGIIRKYLKMMLELAQYRVIVAKNGKEGIELLKKPLQKPDLILVDINMPVMDGYAFIEQKKLLQDDTPAIAVTGNADGLSGEDFKKLSFVDSVYKPADSKQLLNTIQKHLL